ncbi:DoxX family membrane protein [Bacteroides sp. 519]|uniref:DoxX family membrane protein n=1 Tax=Bacteroides sp. 519 TaxID=2302937 RepID=UPI0013D4F32A|nr:DoxX family membrane protein [Bacteroides sp. 519]NDV58075.1 DoxX family membrane protein [Bacteroides sp. 519]
MKNYSGGQTFWLIALRCLVGWHFLYEGVTKLFNSSWSAYPYLMDSKGFFAETFYSIASNPALLDVVNYINVIGLTLVGLGLIAGCFFKLAAIGGICFLAMFYLSHPPFIGAAYMMPTEGTYLWVDKNLIEIGALMVLIYFPTSKNWGLDRYVLQLFNRKAK